MANIPGYIQPQGAGGGGGGAAVSASGAVTSGALGLNTVYSGNIASGQVGDPHFASGSRIDSAEWLADNSFLSAEPISGGSIACAVGFNQSGALWTAMALVSGRMPAVGIVTSNYLSGIVVVVHTNGRIFADSISLSGFMNQPVFVGASGALVSTSGVSNSGIASSGCYNQIVGTVISASGIYVRTF